MCGWVIFMVPLRGHLKECACLLTLFIVDLRDQNVGSWVLETWWPAQGQPSIKSGLLKFVLGEWVAWKVYWRRKGAGQESCPPHLSLPLLCPGTCFLGITGALLNAWGSWLFSHPEFGSKWGLNVWCRALESSPFVFGTKVLPSNAEGVLSTWQGCPFWAYNTELLMNPSSWPCLPSVLPTEWGHPRNKSQQNVLGGRGQSFCGPRTETGLGQWSWEKWAAFFPHIRILSLPPPSSPPLPPKCHNEKFMLKASHTIWFSTL